MTMRSKRLWRTLNEVKSSKTDGVKSLMPPTTGYAATKRTIDAESGGHLSLASFDLSR